MKQLSRFSRLATQLLMGGAFLVLFLGSLLCQAQAADNLPTDMQAVDPSIQSQHKAEMQLIENMKKPQKPDSKDPCDLPGSCNSMNVSSPDPTGCTSGSKCSIEGKICNPGKKCKTLGAPGLCYCGCM